MALKDNIRKRMTELGIGNKALSDKSGVALRTINNILSGNTKNPTIDNMIAISDALECDVESLTSDGARKKIRTAPVYEAAAGEGRINDSYPSDTYEINLADDEFLFKVVGRSMEPTLLDGDLVVVSAQNTVDYKRQIALVKINGDEATLKRVQLKKDGVLLIADNVSVYEPHFFTAEEVSELPVRIEGIVRKVIREL